MVCIAFAENRFRFGYLVWVLNVSVCKQSVRIDPSRQKNNTTRGTYIYLSCF